MKCKCLTSRECLNDAVGILKRHNIENPQQEAEVLLSEVLEVGKLDLYLENFEINNLKLSKLRYFLRMRCEHIPIQYLIKKVFFYGLEFKVTEEVFIPRPETEIIVEAVLNIIRDKSMLNPQLVDIGTGCGNIAISLTKHITSCKMTATDISKISLKIAKDNTKRYNLINKITFLEGDLFKPLDIKRKKDIIISNPPYISLNELDNLQSEVNKEPKLALFGGKDGLYFYKNIINEAPLYLKSSGFLVLELAKDRANPVKDAIKDSLHFRNPTFIKDYNGINRVVIAEKV